MASIPAAPARGKVVARARWRATSCASAAAASATQTIISSARAIRARRGGAAAFGAVRSRLIRVSYSTVSNLIPTDARPLWTAPRRA
ncbi:MAG: hypothetical protein AAF772_15430, partial [Acidobacteriota bacterium]